MQRVGSFSQVGFLAALCLSSSIFPIASVAQMTNATPTTNTRGLKDYASTGQLSILIQDVSGEPFFQGATITLLTADIATRLSTVSDPKGHASFAALPVGQYVVEITAPGYRTVQSHVIIATTREAQSLTASMVPSARNDGKLKPGSPAVTKKALKESDKAVSAMQLNLLDEAQRHLTLALSLDENFADANYLMGLVLLRQKDPGRAAAFLQKSLVLTPDHTPALLALGEAQYLAHDYAHATETLEKFLQADPHGWQASVARKYVDAMHKLLQASASGEASTVSSTPGSAPASGAAGPDTDLPPISELTPEAESNWAPPDVDAEKVSFDADAPCELDAVLKSASSRVQELIRNVDRFTATEQVEHVNLSAMGLESSRESRKFNYLVEMHPVGTTDLEVEEYRNGSDAAKQFPEEIVTAGLPSLALIFHPNLRVRYDFQCEGRATWQGKPAWVVRFQQRADQSSGMLTYQVGSRFFSVGLKGRAWIDVGTRQIVAMESDLVHPVPEIRLIRDHQLIEYGPVNFRNKSTELWLPKSADWYCAMSGKHFHRRHTFSHFLLFSVDDKQQISAPPEPTVTDNPQTPGR